MMPQDPGPAISVVIPMRNALRFLPVCLPSVIAAAEHANGEVLVVDNGSTDGSQAWIAALGVPSVRTFSAPDVTISALRNLGAKHARSDILSFVDADCEVPGDYLERALRALRATGADAVGSPYVPPRNPHWIEIAWHELHGSRRDGDATHLPGGNFVLRRAAFDAVSGFDEQLETGEDAELCQRLRQHGFRISRVADVEAIHHGNPKSLGAFFRKQRWHALGMFGTTGTREIDKPVVMMFAHAAALLMAVGIAAVPNTIGRATTIAVFVCLVNAVPAAAVAYRLASSRSDPGLLRALLLYHVYFAARLAALGKLLARRWRRGARESS